MTGQEQLKRYRTKLLKDFYTSGLKRPQDDDRTWGGKEN